MNAIIGRQMVARILACLTFITLGLLIMPGRAPAQTFRGAILGTVFDASGAPVPDAQVTATQTATGLARSTVSDDAGNYHLPELPIGEYSITITKQGFDSVTVRDLRVEIAGERRADVTLNPGRIEQRVEVTAQVPLVATTSNVLGGTVEAPQIVSLPVNGRDYIKLIFTNPGISGSPDQATDSPGSFGLFTANGARGRSNNYLLDGTDMNDGYRNLPSINQAGVFGTPATILPVEALAEVAVLSNFEPEYGRNAGAVVNIVTKSGTNEFHGSVYEFFRNNALDARNFFNVAPNPKTAFRNNQFGASLGGPLARNKTFFFASYEGQRERVGLNSLARVPTPAEIAAATASVGGAVNPVIQALLGRNPWPAPNINSSLPLFDDSGTPNTSVTTRASNRIDSLIVKGDHNINANNLLTGRYYFGDSDQSFPLALLAGNVLPGYNTVTPTRVQLVSISYLRVVSPTQVNEARFGWNRFTESFFPEDRSFDPTSIGLNTGASTRDTGLPFMRLTGVASIGSTLSVPRGRVDTNWQFIDNYSWKFNKHEVKLGYEFRRTTVDGFFDAGYRGRIDFREDDLQTSLGNFLLGIPSGGRSARGNSDRNTFQNSHAGYAQDSFRVSRKFTFNYGVRWDYYGVIGEEKDLLSNFDPANGLQLVGGPGLPRLYDRDWNNFAPRASLAYDLTGNARTVLRAGWGVFYDVFSQDFFAGQLPFNTFNPGPAYNPIGPAAVLFAFDVNRDANGDALPLDAATSVFPNSNFFDSDVFAVDRHARTPYMQNYNFNIERQISDHAMLQVGYVGSAGRKLFRYRDINQPTAAQIAAYDSQAAGGCCAPRPFDNGPLAPSGGTFFYVNHLETTALSSYNSLQTSFRLRGMKGFDSVLNYTWSHSIDNASDGQDFVANATQPDNSHNPGGERANSNFDVRHRFVWNFMYELPRWKGRWSKLTDGWQLNGVLTLQAGQPFHVVLFDDYNGTGEFFPRPDIIGDPFSGTNAPDSFLNLAAFRVPCTLDPAGDGSAASCLAGTQHFGTEGRNSLRGPAYKNLDFSLFKNTELTEKLTLQFRAEFYNLPNHPNFASPLLPGFAADASFNGIDSVTGQGVGFLPLVVTGDVGIGNPFLGGGGPRGIQLALKLMF